MSAPVCHIPPATTIDQPSPHNLPAVPAPTPTIAGLMATVEALRRTILLITGQQGTQGPRGQSGPRGQDVTAKGQWKEDKASRVVERVKVYSKSNPTDFVEVEQVQAIKMVNKDTGQSWDWRR